MDKIKVAVVKDTSKKMLGLHGHDAGFIGLPGVEFIAHVDSNVENIEEKMSMTGAKRHYTTMEEMLDKETPDIVLLTSRHPYDHLEQIRMVAEKGCHIYCEKPMTIDLREADEIVSIVEKANIKVCIGHPSRYALSYLKMKEMIEAGEIGTPIKVVGRGKCDHRGGGEDLICLGTHILDLMIFFFGNPESVWADVGVDGKPALKTDLDNTVEPLGPVIGDDIYAVYRFPNGIRGVFESKRNLADLSNGVLNMGLAVIGTKGVISMRFADTAHREVLHISRQTNPIEDYSNFEEVPVEEKRVIPGAAPIDFSVCGKKAPPAHWFLASNHYAAWDLICSIREDRLPVSNIYNARTTQEMIQGIFVSHLSGGLVKWPLTDRTHPLES